MGKKESMPETIVRHRGFFDFDKLINTIQDWYREEQYEYQVTEHKQKAGDLGFEVRFLAQGNKKITEYVKFYMDVRIAIFGMRDVEVIQDGKKLKLQEGHALVEIMPFYELDWQERFGGSKLAEWMGLMLEKYILKYKIGDYWEDMLLDSSTAFAHTIKHALGQEL
ncbi:hypothetical protein HY489_01380 [Candidatus Woesearchaeota archaeon]|nr:hypothetical protein [Candidatus Woesearchaeota archaeon]